jgi:hypothetical protein
MQEQWKHYPLFFNRSKVNKNNFLCNNNVTSSYYIIDTREQSNLIVIKFVYVVILVLGHILNILYLYNDAIFLDIIKNKGKVFSNGVYIFLEVHILQIQLYCCRAIILGCELFSLYFIKNSQYKKNVSKKSCACYRVLYLHMH